MCISKDYFIYYWFFKPLAALDDHDDGGPRHDDGGPLHDAHDPPRDDHDHPHDVHDLPSVHPLV